MAVKHQADAGGCGRLLVAGSVLEIDDGGTFVDAVQCRLEGAIEPIRAGAATAVGNTCHPQTGRHFDGRAVEDDETGVAHEGPAPVGAGVDFVIAEDRINAEGRSQVSQLGDQGLDELRIAVYQVPGDDDKIRFHGLDLVDDGTQTPFADERAEMEIGEVGDDQPVGLCGEVGHGHLDFDRARAEVAADPGDCRQEERNDYSGGPQRDDPRTQHETENGHQIDHADREHEQDDATHPHAAGVLENSPEAGPTVVVEDASEGIGGEPQAEPDQQNAVSGAASEGGQRPQPPAQVQVQQQPNTENSRKENKKSHASRHLQAKRRRPKRLLQFLKADVSTPLIVLTAHLTDARWARCGETKCRPISIIPVIMEFRAPKRSRPRAAWSRAPIGVRRLCVVVGLAGAALAFAPYTAADEFPEDDPIVLSGTLDERIQIIDGWRYHPGDDLAWADPTIDDTSWPVASSLLTKGVDPPGGWPGIGWFRRRLELADNMPATAVAIRVWQPGASEVYLDGRLVIRNGVVSSDVGLERPFYANDFSGIAITPGCTHLLAVRYSNVRQNDFANGMRGFGFNLRSVQSAANAYHRWDFSETVVPSLFFGAFASLALLHLLLFAFHRASREHLYFALFATALALALMLEIGQALETDLQARLLIFKLSVAARAAAVLAGLSLVNTVFRRRPRWTAWLIAVAAVAVVGWIASWTAYASRLPLHLFLLVGYLEMLRVSVAAVVRRERDAWIVATAFVPLAVGGASQMLSQMFAHPIAIIPLVRYVSFILVAIAFSVFISRRAARTARELELRLDEVEELSQRALSQERRALREEAERHVLETERERRQNELDAARRLQLAMLPRSVPRIGAVDVAYRMVTATEVGGDYVDVRTGGAGQTLLTVGDATSHGLQAGMVVAVAKSLFQGVNPDERPAHVLQRIGRELQSMSERHASMAMVVIAISDKQLEVASAGMPPLLVRRAATGMVEELLLPGVPLGTLPNPTYPVRTIPIASGDVVLVISDGVVETLDADDEPFGYEKVAAHLARTKGPTADEVVTEVLDAVIDFAGEVPLQDDVTVLGMVVT